MDKDVLTSRVKSALRGVRSPAAGTDVLEAGMVRDLRVDPDGGIAFGLVLAPGDPEGLAGEAREAAGAVEGVRSVRVSVEGGRGPRRGSGRALPVVGAPDGEGGDASPGGATPGGSAGAGKGAGGPRPVQADRDAASRHPSDAPTLEGVGHVIAVSSGKGGVGKSTVATNLAAAWAASGHRVGLLDADIYGPDIPTMFGVRGRPRMAGERVIPLEGHGVKLMSLGFLVDEDTPAIWRGPIIMGIVRQFLQQVDWGELDFLVVDLPPGTGDAQLSLCQLVRLSGAVMVTTPQDVAVGGVLKGIRMFQKLEVPVLGVVENMRGFACPDCGTTHEIFGSGGGEKLAAALEIDFLGAVPLGMAVREEGDRGIPTVVGRPEAPEARALGRVAAAAERRIRAREEDLAHA